MSSAAPETVRRVDVPVGARGYPVFIGDGLLADVGTWSSFISDQVLVISNETVGPLYLEALRPALDGLNSDVLILPDGEEHKTLGTVQRIWDHLADLRFDRGCTLLALGGGVVCDIAGFAAACYRRGVAFIALPTTLLAQTDAAVGGKTGVNLAQGKNLIGAFHQPRAVISDTRTLGTLPRRQLHAGAAEVIKYGLIGDGDFLTWLEGNLPALLKLDPDALAHAIERSCRNKAEVVAADEREAGVRALLNFGHTFAHAVETATGYRSWLHGEAVGLGMRLAARLSQRMGHLEGPSLARIEALLDLAGLPDRLPAELGPDACIQLMYGDKKVQAGRLRLVLLRDIGEAFVTSEVDASLLHEVLEAAQCD